MSTLHYVASLESEHAQHNIILRKAEHNLVLFRTARELVSSIADAMQGEPFLATLVFNMSDLSQDTHKHSRPALFCIRISVYPISR